MDNFEDIKRLWNSENTSEIPDVKQIQTIFKKYQNKKKRNAFWLTGLFIACSISFLFIIIFHKPLLWTTTFGEILISLGFLLGIILKLKTLKKISKDELKSNKEYLKDLMKSSSQEKSKANWHLIISVLFLTIGYGFFLYEEFKENQTQLILSYIGITLFTGVIYFIFRPLVKKISKKNIKKVIEAMEDSK
ncbi:hypothetical protein LVD15_21010 [Fulvivirga maritima]|uniref:hypothetical protein n=1 Tax=Fulvivirga maritima TaxID=2904247 RepID=UPI001F39C002|nr:hypothetical protein [Fulvivirga maritima]UII25761.1 hypothetical protein LVD15_21010 [Fulvivirga maritima]